MKKTNKETLRMQMLAGIITEGEYKQKLNENIFDNHINQTVSLINQEIGSNPGYFFFGDEDDINQFDDLWNDEKYKEALDLLASAHDIDVSNYDEIMQYINSNR
jgi:hypothetical protein